MMDLESLCDGLDLTLDRTVRGCRLVSSAGHAVTIVHGGLDELLDDVVGSDDQIKIASLVVPPGSFFVERHIENLSKARAEITEVAATAPGVQERLRAMVSNVPAGIDVSLPFELLGLQERALGNVPRHRAVLNQSERMAQECPSRLVLPLGAVVRLKNDYDYPEYCALDPRRFGGIRLLPAAGSTAFVAGNGFGQDERGVVILFTGPFESVGEESPRTHPDPHRGYALCVRPEDVALVSLAETFDGETCLYSEIVPSHRATYNDGHPPALVLALRSSGSILIYQTGTYASPLDNGTAVYDEGGLDFDLLPLVQPSTAALL
jgi:hypothetical protein